MDHFSAFQKEAKSLSEGPPFYLTQFVSLIFQTPIHRSHYFGYYDKCPLDHTQGYLLAHGVNFDGRNIGVDDLAEVGYFDMAGGQWHVIGQTKAFNWQQGAMLQWLGPDYQSRLIYNDQSGDSFVSIIVDLNSGKKRTVPFPVYAVHPNGKIAITVNFERHFFCRAYHYEGVRNEKWNCMIHPEDGLFRIDLDRGTSKLILGTEEIAHVEPLPEMVGSDHWLEHVMWNPAGTRFAFLHRFGKSENFKTRLYTADADGKDLYRFPDMDAISHMAWRNDDEFVVWAQPKSAIRKAYANLVESRGVAVETLIGSYRWVKKHIFTQNLVKNLSRRGGAYMCIRDKSDAVTALNSDGLCEDGHPSWTRDGRYMLTDTYADQSSFRHLILFDSKKSKVYPLGKFYSQYNNSGYRCDLHPRFSHDEKKIIIDSFHASGRQMCVMDISQVISL